MPAHLKFIGRLRDLKGYGLLGDHDGSAILCHNVKDGGGGGGGGGGPHYYVTLRCTYFCLAVR